MGKYQDAEDLIGGMITGQPDNDPLTVKNFNQKLLDEWETQSPNFWKAFLDYMNTENQQSTLGTMPIRQGTMKYGTDNEEDGSIFGYISNKIDFPEDKNFYDFLKNSESNPYWNESIQESISRFFNKTDLERIREKEKSIKDFENQIVENDVVVLSEEDGTIKTNGNYYRVKDLVNGDAGAHFGRIPWVRPWYNSSGDTYSKVRAEDKMNDVLNNDVNLQFTEDNSLNTYMRLIMPKYLRNVEIEDLNRNFWVIGQTMTAILAYLFEDGNPYQKIFKDILNELVQLWENTLYLWGAIATISQPKVYDKVHVEIVTLNNNEGEPYIKNDNFDNFSKLENYETLELKSRLHYLIDMYQDCNLIILPKVRIGNYNKNWYWEEYYPGILAFDRNVDDDFRFCPFSGSAIDINLNTIDNSVGDYLAQNSAALNLETSIDEDDIETDLYNFYYPYNKVPELSDDKKRYYCLIRTKPEIKVKYHVGQNNYFSFDTFKISVFDAATEIFEGKQRQLGYFIPSYYWQLNNGQELQVTFVEEKTQVLNEEDENVDYDPISLEKVTSEVQKGFYQGEMVSYYKRSQ